MAAQSNIKNIKKAKEAPRSPPPSSHQSAPTYLVTDIDRCLRFVSKSGRLPLNRAALDPSCCGCPWPDGLVAAAVALARVAGAAGAVAGGAVARLVSRRFSFLSSVELFQAQSCRKNDLALAVFQSSHAVARAGYSSTYQGSILEVGGGLNKTVGCLESVYVVVILKEADGKERRQDGMMVDAASFIDRTCRSKPPLSASRQLLCITPIRQLQKQGKSQVMRAKPAPATYMTQGRIRTLPPPRAACTGGVEPHTIGPDSSLSRRATTPFYLRT